MKLPEDCFFEKVDVGLCWEWTGKYARNEIMCKKGHLYAEVGRYTSKLTGYRACCECSRENTRRYRKQGAS